MKMDLDLAGLEVLTQKTMEQLDDVEASIGNPVPYVPHLEYGSSRQAPHGMVRVSMPEIAEAFAKIVASMDFNKAVREGTLHFDLCERVNLAADFAMGLIRDRTPIRTGRARRGWYVNEAE